MANALFPDVPNLVPVPRNPEPGPIYLPPAPAPSPRRHHRDRDGYYDDWRGDDWHHYHDRDRGLFPVLIALGAGLLLGGAFRG